MAPKKKGNSAPEAKSPEEFKDRGNAAFLSGKYEDALRFYQSAIDMEPSASLFSNLSTTFVSLKRFDEALAAAERSIELNPQWPKGYLRKGQALEQMFRYGDALKSFEAGLAVDANDASLTTAATTMKGVIAELHLSATGQVDENPDTARFERLIQWMKTSGL